MFQKHFNSIATAITALLRRWSLFYYSNIHWEGVIDSWSPQQPKARKVSSWSRWHCVYLNCFELLCEPGCRCIIYIYLYQLLDDCCRLLCEISRSTMAMICNDATFFYSNWWHTDFYTVSVCGLSKNCGNWWHTDLGHFDIFNFSTMQFFLVATFWPIAACTPKLVCRDCHTEPIKSVGSRTPSNHAPSLQCWNLHATWGEANVRLYTMPTMPTMLV